MHINSMLSFMQASYAAEKLQGMGYDQITIGTESDDPFLKGTDSECGWSVVFRPIVSNRRQGWRVVGWFWQEFRGDGSKATTVIHSECDGLDQIINDFDRFNA